MMTVRRAQWMLIIGIAGLATMRLAYDLTYEPAPAVRVEWRKDIPGWRRTLLEQWYRLGDRQAPHGNSYAYELFDTRSNNIRALITNRYVVGTGNIDRANFAVALATRRQSDEMMWVADRVPVLRFRTVRLVLIATCLALLFAAVRQNAAT